MAFEQDRSHFREDRLWWLISAMIVTFLCVQFWSGTRINQRARELHQNLDNTYSLALKLNQAMGYGGLIHHFKNFLLRPSETYYYEAGLKSADDALLLLDAIAGNARNLKIEADLHETRSIINGYKERLKSLPTLMQSGQSVASVDSLLRIDDEPAVREIGLLMTQLSSNVKTEVATIHREGMVQLLVGLMATVSLSILVAWLIFRRQQRSRQLNAIRTMNHTLQESNETLTTSNSSLEQFAGMVSHDLKSPLTHVTMLSELIEEDIDDREAVFSHVEMIQRSVSRMNELIASLLDFTRTGYKDPRLEKTDMRTLISDVVDEMKISIEQKGATVVIDAEGEVLVDPHLIRRVLWNLLDNSLKYVEEGQPPHISIEARLLDATDSGTLQVSVNDEGIGIPDAHVQRVFEPMQRLHGAQSQYAGIGLGLSLAKSVIQAHGGEIHALSNVEKGSCVRFTLPHAGRVQDADQTMVYKKIA